MKNWLHYVKIMKQASKNGVFFPTGSAVVSKAPLGSTEPPVKGNLLKRLQAEISWFRISRHQCPIPNLRESISILHLTDIHIRDDNAWLQQLCQTIQGMQPDIVAITGDVVARGWDEQAVTRFLSSLPKAKLGRYAVMGNWEYWTGIKPHNWSRLLASHDVVLLHESWQDLGNITILGTDDHLAGNSTPEVWIPNLPHQPTVALSHSPALFPRLAYKPINLVLAGHSHGGQLRPPFLGAFWVPRGTGKYVVGWHKQGDSHLFVSRGIGWSVAPVRLWCPPEIAWIELLPSNSITRFQKSQR